jgi:hypothetical protein
LRGQPYRYSSFKPRGFPSTSAAMTARTSSGPLPKNERCLTRRTGGAAAASLRGADAGRGGAGRGCGGRGDDVGAGA